MVCWMHGRFRRSRPWNSSSEHGISGILQARSAGVRTVDVSRSAGSLHRHCENEANSPFVFNNTPRRRMPFSLSKSDGFCTGRSTHVGGTDTGGRCTLADAWLGGQSELCPRSLKGDVCRLAGRLQKLRLVGLRVVAGRSWNACVLADRLTSTA